MRCCTQRQHVGLVSDCASRYTGAMRWGTYLLLLVVAFCGPAVPCQADEPATVKPLPRAHAHNDYEHARPLLDALDHGFCSIEADVWLVEGKLLVAHDRNKVKAERTLQTLYLEPLRERARVHGGRVYRAGPGAALLVDV